MASLADFKDKTRDLLLQAQAGGLMSVKECENRLEILHVAQTIDEIEPLVEDLLELEPENSTNLVALKESPVTLTTVMSEQRVSPSQLSRQLTAVCVMGSCLLDYRKVQFPAGESRLKVNLVMGELEILLPPQVEVQSSLSVIMAEIRPFEAFLNLKGTSSKLLLSGCVVMGSLKIR